MTPVLLPASLLSPPFQVPAGRAGGHPGGDDGGGGGGQVLPPACPPAGVGCRWQVASNSTGRQRRQAADFPGTPDQNKDPKK